MGGFDEIDEGGKSFLLELFAHAGGETSAQVSMYEVGDGLGFDRQTASRVGEDLMGLGLVEVRTLSGGIGMTDDGLAAARRFGAGGGPEEEEVRLGSDPVMTEPVCRAVAEVADGLKCESGKIGLDFDPLCELVADLKTIDAQLMSSRPKTAIIRECLRSIHSTLGQDRAREWTARIDRLTGQDRT